MAKQAAGFWGHVKRGLEARGLPEVEEGTFYSPRLRAHLSSLKPGELRELFSGLELVSYSEGFSPDVTHDEPHTTAGPAWSRGVSSLDKERGFKV